jgi:hypothetical protein
MHTEILQQIWKQQEDSAMLLASNKQQHKEITEQKDTNRRDKTHRKRHQRRTKTRRRKETQKGRIKLKKQ